LTKVWIVLQPPGADLQLYHDVGTIPTRLQCKAIGQRKGSLLHEIIGSNHVEAHIHAYSGEEDLSQKMQHDHNTKRSIIMKLTIVRTPRVRREVYPNIHAGTRSDHDALRGRWVTIVGPRSSSPVLSRSLSGMRTPDTLALV